MDLTASTEIAHVTALAMVFASMESVPATTTILDQTARFHYSATMPAIKSAWAILLDSAASFARANA